MQLKMRLGVAPQQPQWDRTHTLVSGCMMDAPSGRVLAQMLAHVDEALHQSPEGADAPPPLRLPNSAMQQKNTGTKCIR